MRYCVYCGQRATLEIPSTPGEVCLTHAIEFWTGLLAHVRQRSTELQTELQTELPCADSLRRVFAARAAKASPGSRPHRERSPVRLAS
jgi:hypothetical protein